MTAPAAFRYPPGPSESATEQVRRWIETPIDYWEECERLYGSATTLELGSLGRVILLSDPDHIREVFRLPADAFEVTQYNEHYRYVMGDRSVLLQDGVDHRRQRKLLQPLFRHDKLAPQMNVLRAMTRLMIDAWPRGTAFNPRPALHDLMFGSMVQLLFGDLDSHTSATLLTSYRESVAKQVGSWGPWRNFARMQPAMRKLLASEIVARRADPERPGYFTQIVASRTADGAFINDDECEDHVFTQLVAGVDTSAIALAWAMHWLSRSPAIRQRLVEELSGGVADDRALVRLPVLDAVYNETIRMYPIVPTPSGRKLLRELELGEFAFPIGTTLVPCTYLVHRREELYPDPHAFRPERFLERTFAPHEYLPYGGGARICVGEMLAQVEFKLVVSTILAERTLGDVTSPAMRPVRHGTLLAPPDGLEITLS
jgi:unspecific monooxygenase